MGSAVGPAVPRRGRGRLRTSLQAPAFQPARGPGRRRGRYRSAPQGTVPAGTRRRRGHHPHPPGPPHPQVADLVEDRTALDLDDLADPGPARIRHRPAAEETPVVLAPVRSRTAQPALAGRHDSLAARRRHAGGDLQPSRRPLATRPGVCPATHHHRTRRRRRLPRRLRALGNPRQRAHRQRGSLHRPPPPRRKGRPRDRARPSRRPVRPLTTQPPADPRQGRTLPTDREEVARRPATGQDHHRPAAPAHPVPPLLQRGPTPPGPGRRTPWRAYTDRPKATATGPYIDPHCRVRHDRVDKTGTVTLRHDSRLHHIGLGRLHAGTRVTLWSTPSTSGSSTATPASSSENSPSTQAATSSPAESRPALPRRTPDMQRCPERPVNGVPRHHTGRADSVLVQDISDRCLKTFRTDVCGDPGLNSGPARLRPCRRPDWSSPLW